MQAANSKMPVVYIVRMIMYARYAPYIAKSKMPQPRVNACFLASGTSTMRLAIIRIDKS